MNDAKIRCDWSLSDPLMVSYHDNEWGKPLHDDQKLFENFVLDGFQAGLSWKTILRKREGFRKAFHNFDMNQIAVYSDIDINRLLVDPSIIRNKQKILAAINNAQKTLKVQEDFGNFSAYIWSFTEGKVIVNNWKTMGEIPATSPLSDIISRDMKKRGFSFAGSTICYAFLQAVGVVNDHIVTCFCRNQ
ncbi:MAG: DNA-3-methyladenine glycosylase I [Bacteroidales bacterium]|nr:DNA-3-methyladenine glycosylase I [Bacteroidales bacterium]